MLLLIENYNIHNNKKALKKIFILVITIIINIITDILLILSLQSLNTRWKQDFSHVVYNASSLWK